MNTNIKSRVRLEGITMRVVVGIIGGRVGASQNHKTANVFRRNRKTASKFTKNRHNAFSTLCIYHLGSELQKTVSLSFS